MTIRSSISPLRQLWPRRAHAAGAHRACSASPIRSSVTGDRPGRASRAGRTARWSQRDGQVVGSALDRSGRSPATRQYFQGRPSAAGDGYDPLADRAPATSAWTAPTWSRLVEERRAAAARARRAPPGDVAPDALLASGSGLDPQISPEYAAQQVARVARERGLARRRVRDAGRASTPRAAASGSSASRGSTCSMLNLALDARAERAVTARRRWAYPRHGSASTSVRPRASGKTYAMLGEGHRRRRARHRRGRRLRRDPRPRAHRRAARRPRGRASPHAGATAARRSRRWTSTRCSLGRPRSRWSTSSPTPTSPARATRSAGRTSRSCSPPAST